MEGGLLALQIGVFCLLLGSSAGIELPPAPAGEIYGLLPDPDLEIPPWEEPYTGPDIPLSYLAQSEDSSHPEQVILYPAVRDGSSVFVTWSLPKGVPNSEGFVRYGTAEDALTRESKCSSKEYSYAVGTQAEYHSGSIFACPIGPLEPSTMHFYQIQGLPTVFSFKSLPAKGHKSITFGLMADVGQTVNSSRTFDLTAESAVDFVLFSGDLSYADNYGWPGCTPYQGPGTDKGWGTCGVGGVRWDSFNRLAQKVFAHVPVAMVPGNHEIEYNTLWGEKEPFKAYTARIPSLLDDFVGTMPARVADATAQQRWSSQSPLFYSLDIGPTHILGLNSYTTFVKYTYQDYWIKADLAAIDRETTPWLLAIVHTPWYSSNVAHYLEGEPMRTAFEPYLFNYRTDLVAAGHVHAYERHHPVYNYEVNECGPTYVTVGDGGNDEGVAGPFLEPQPVYSAYRELSFGHAELTIYNDIVAIYTWYRNQDSTHLVGDEFVVYNKHHKCGLPRVSFDGVPVNTEAKMEALST